MSNMPPNFTPSVPIPTPPVPIPSNVPVAWLGMISSVSGVIAFGIIPAIHYYYPTIPTLDVTVVQSALGILVSVAIVVHSFGWQTAIKFLIQNLSPQIIKAVEVAVAAQIQHNNSVGPLSAEDVVVIKHARYNRSMDKSL